MPAQSDLRHLQAKHAAAKRWGTDTADDNARDYAAARLESYIKRVVDNAPQLTPAQRDRLALLLRGAGA